MRTHRPSTKRNDDAGSMHGTLLAVALLMLALLLAPAADAQAGPRPNTQPGPAVAPARQAAVPEWVVPGARITQFGTTAQQEKVNPGRESRWRAEERRARQRDIDAGLSADEVERRARQREEARAADRRLFKLGSGIQSYRQYDIIAVTDAGVLIESRLYNISPLGGPPEAQNSVTKVLVDRATGAGLWMHPDVITDTRESRGEDGGPIVYKAPYTLGEHTFDAIMIVTTGGDYTRREIYDRATGMQLYQSELTDTNLIRSHAYSQVVNYRVAELPWIGTRFTPAIQNARRLTYGGARVFAAQQPAPELGRIPDMRVGQQSDFVITQSSADLIVADLTFQMQGPQGPNVSRAQTYHSPNARFGLYIDPQVLAQLEQNQILDRDPAIGYTIYVSNIYQQNGTTYVEITEVGPDNSYNAASTYDASFGLLVAGNNSYTTQNQRLEFSLQHAQ